jgi:cellulose biosynthesis protein BcsQ
VPPIIHRDEALEAAKVIGQSVLDRHVGATRVALVDDVFARLHLYIWLANDDGAAAFEEEWPMLQQRLQEECGPFWSGNRLLAVDGPLAAEDEVMKRAREVGVSIGGPSGRDRLLLVDRHRSRSSWFSRISEPSEDLRKVPVVAFYSFKGGMGRTTAAAAYAIQRARAGARVVVVDLDLDAPGIGQLLAGDENGQTAPWGVLDFLLEHRSKYPLQEYRHVCARSEVTGEAVIDVFPAAAPNDQYLSKLSKIDFDLRETDDPSGHAIALLLNRIRSELQPEVIVVDCRAGLAPVAGLMLTGLADVHVLFSTASKQAMDGLARVVPRLGAERLRRGLPQAECVLVQAMVPENVDARKRSTAYFEAKAENVFDEHYYAKEIDEAGQLWSLDDKSSQLAPHRALAIPYSASLSDFRDIKDVLSILQGAVYSDLVKRVEARLLGAPQVVSNADEEVG